MVLIGVALLAIGGLAAGIARSTAAPTAVPPGFDRQFLGSSIQLGSGWASFVLAVLLLGVMGVCWWNLREWELEADETESPEDTAESDGHLRRGCGIVTATELALVVIGAGAIAAFVGTLLEIQSGVAVWSVDFVAGAGTLAVLVVATTGVLLGRRLVGELLPEPRG